MKKQRFLAIVFMFALVTGSSGCSHRFVAGVRKLFVKPAVSGEVYRRGCAEALRSVGTGRGAASNGDSAGLSGGEAGGVD